MLIIPGIPENLTSRVDGSWKLTTGFNEMTPEMVSELVKALHKWVFFAMKIDEFKPKDLELISSLQSEMEFSEKPPSQRMKAVLYRLWEVNNEGYEDFELYYRFHMEKIIKHLKSKLP